ncbi:hypothetical protein [Actinomadura atramentaria]|uniref:hypothetical protein n=1 Tax=Actinomadura atramentaria TaxID=1990 RepID=UPI001F0A9070|nr:hypothetical protein [Actinomadura atramentaria]
MSEYAMRPARSDDVDAVGALILARARWMAERDLDGAQGWADGAVRLAAQITDPRFPVWALTRVADGRVAGVTSVFTQTPPWGWTEDERAESALFLASTVTDPELRADRPGCVIAWWALGHAARNGYRWVRRGCGSLGLVRYYRDVQGWTLSHTVERHGETAYLLARRATVQRELSAE